MRTLRIALLFGALIALALPGAAAAAGPPFPSPLPDQRVYDTADALQPATREHAEQIAHAIAASSGIEVVVYTQQADTGPVDPESTRDHAAALRDAWQASAGRDDGLVMLVELEPDGTLGQIAIDPGPGIEAVIDPTELAGIETEVAEWVASDSVDTAVIVGLAELLRESLAGDTPPAVPADPGAPADAPAPGPPFPDPVEGQAVYDFAGVFDPSTIAEVETTIDAIEQRTGAEVAVYSQVVDYGVTEDETEARARALIDQWGIGRAGFDDGLVVFFDLDPSLEHGQVQLYAAPGFEATFLDNAARQRIFDEDMLPHLQSADLDGALLAVLRIAPGSTLRPR